MSYKKTIDLGDTTGTGTLAEFNTALQSESFASLGGTETFTGQKTFSLDAKMAAGKGIDFSANTGSGGETSEVLDWYEEGTWTPTLQDTSLSNAEGQTYGANSGIYTRIGRQVFIEFVITMTSLGTLNTAQTAYINGLPFSALGGEGIIVAQYGSNLSLTAGTNVTGYTVAGETYISLRVWDAAGGSSQLPISAITASGQFKFAGHYMV